MPKALISAQQVVNSVKFLVAKGYSPTLAAVREQLGCRGSNSTIHKYLVKWKQQCFKKAINECESPETDVNLIEEKRILEQTLSKQITQNEHYAQELINAEKANIASKEEIRQLQAKIQGLRLQLAEAKSANHSLEQVTQEIKNRLNVNDNKTIQKMQQMIDDLSRELKALNETSLSAIRDTSTQGHEALMQEKLISINLQAKVDGLTKELAEKNKQLELFELKTQVQVRSLQRQIKVQQQALQRFITPEELSELIQGLAPNLLLSDSYGK